MDRDTLLRFVLTDHTDNGHYLSNTPHLLKTISKANISWCKLSGGVLQVYCYSMKDAQLLVDDLRKAGIEASIHHNSDPRGEEWWETRAELI